MLWKTLLALFTLAVCLGVGLADEFRARITKVDGDKVTFNASTKDTKVDDKTLPVADKVKVVKGKYNEETKKVEAGDPIEGGLKASVFTKIDKEGVRATIITDADNKKITEIRVGGKKK
jgi:ABC-type uncharacterized transport system YnjBCD substrate-binding protein